MHSLFALCVVYQRPRDFGYLIFRKTFSHKILITFMDPLKPLPSLLILIRCDNGIILFWYLYLTDTFKDSYVPTIEDTYRQVICCNKNICTLQITDTTGSHQFPAMQRLNISKGHAFMLVYRYYPLIITIHQSLQSFYPLLVFSGGLISYLLINPVTLACLTFSLSLFLTLFVSFSVCLMKV